MRVARGVGRAGGGIDGAKLACPVEALEAEAEELEGVGSFRAGVAAEMEPGRARPVERGVGGGSMPPTLLGRLRGVGGETDEGVAGVRDWAIEEGREGGREARDAREGGFGEGRSVLAREAEEEGRRETGVGTVVVGAAAGGREAEVPMVERREEGRVTEEGRVDAEDIGRELDGSGGGLNSVSEGAGDC